LRHAGADVRIVSLRPGRIRGMNFLFRGKKLPVDHLVSRARPEEYGALLLPGGFVNPDLLRQSKQAREFVRQFDALERPIATLCHGPEVLISAGLVDGRRLTSWPGIADDIRNAGGSWENGAVVRDRNWVASRSPLDLVPFCNAMIDLFDAEGVRDLAPAPRRVRYVARLTHVATLAAIATAAAAGRAAFRSLGAKRLSIGLLGAAGVLAAAGRLLVPRGRNARRMGLRLDALRRPAGA
jgi:protease I